MFLMQDVDSFLLQQNVSALPGVGWSGARKLEALGAKTIADLRACRAADIQRVLGAKSGEELINYAHGRDTREVRCARWFGPPLLCFICLGAAALQVLSVLKPQSYL